MRKWQAALALGLPLISFYKNPPKLAFQPEIALAIAQAKQVKSDNSIDFTQPHIDAYHNYIFFSETDVAIGATPFLKCYGVIGTVNCYPAK